MALARLKRCLRLFNWQRFCGLAGTYSVAEFDGGKARLGKVMKAANGHKVRSDCGPMSRIASHAYHIKPAGPWLQVKL